MSAEYPVPSATPPRRHRVEPSSPSLTFASESPSEMEAIRARIDSTQIEVHEGFSSLLGNHEEYLHSFKKMFAQSSTRRVEIDDTLDTLQKDVTSIKASIEKLTNKGTQVDAKLFEMDAKLFEMDAKLFEMDDKLFEMGGKMQEMGGKMQEMGGKMQDMGGKMQEMDDKLDKILRSGERPWLEQRLRYAFIAARHKYAYHMDLWRRLYSDRECFTGNPKMIEMWNAGRDRTNSAQDHEMQKIRLILSLLKGIGKICEGNEYSHCTDIELPTFEESCLIQWRRDHTGCGFAN